MKETGCTAVKLEGGKNVCPQIEAIVNAQIPVCAHIGLTPQSSNMFGGFRVQGKSEEAAKELIEAAQARMRRTGTGISGYVSNVWKLCA